MTFKWMMCAIGLLLVSWGQVDSAPLTDLQKNEKLLSQLETEHRIRRRAVGTLVELSLFDETGMMGRSVSEFKAETILPPDRGNGVIGTTGISLELKLTPDLIRGFEPEPLEQLARDIADLKTSIARFKNNPKQEQ